MHPHTPRYHKPSFLTPLHSRKPSPTSSPSSSLSIITEVEADSEGSWMPQIWHDFLANPVPVLVALGLVYLACILLLTQYWGPVWKVVGFFKDVLPWDAEFRRH